MQDHYNSPLEFCPQCGTELVPDPNRPGCLYCPLCKQAVRYERPRAPEYTAQDVMETAIRESRKMMQSCLRHSLRALIEIPQDGWTEEITEALRWLALEHHWTPVEWLEALHRSIWAASVEVAILDIGEVQDATDSQE